MKPGPKPRRVADRFWPKVGFADRRQCWEWQAFRGPLGYGRITIAAVPRNAHRVAWELEHGPVPDGLEVCHKCDNPPCCNPEHLFLGTHTENMADAKAKGRMWKRGMSNEENPTTRIPNAEIVKIRELYAAGGVTQRQLARAFGCTQAHISQVIRQTVRRL